MYTKYAVSITKKEKDVMMDAMILDGKTNIKIIGTRYTFNISEQDYLSYSRTDNVVEDIKRSLESFEVVYEFNNYFVTKVILALSIDFIETKGYRPSRLKNNTKTSVLRKYRQLLIGNKKNEIRELLSKYKEDVEATYLLYSKEKKTKDFYLQRTYQLLETEYIHYNQLGYVVSAYVKLRNTRLMELDVESEYVASIDEEVEADVRVEEIRLVTSSYGDSWLVRMRTLEGDLLSMFVTSESKLQGYKLYHEYTLVFTVGKHVMYKGIKSTTIRKVRKLRRNKGDDLIEIS